MEFWIKLEVSIVIVVNVGGKVGFDMDILLETSEGFCHISSTVGRGRTEGKS
jgi:hypothetical protein